MNNLKVTRKNLVLITGIALILVMVLSVVSISAWPWTATGDATFVGPYKVYLDQTKTVKIFGNSYDVKVISIDTYGALFIGDIGGATVVLKGQTTQVGNLQIKLIDTSLGTWLSKPSVKFSVAEAESGTSGGGESGTTEGICGDGVCSGTETSSSCAADCGQCYANLTNDVKKKVVEIRQSNEVIHENIQIVVQESDKIYKKWYVLVPSPDGKGSILKVSTLVNSTTAYSGDAVKFKNVLTGDTYSTTITQDGVGTLIVYGDVYDVRYGGLATVSDDRRWVTLTSKTVEYPEYRFQCYF